MIGEMPVISQLLSDGAIVAPMSAGSKREILDGLLDIACENRLVSDCAGVRKAVFDREAQMSTGVGRGLALPHARTDAGSGTVAVMAVLEHPADYDSLDGEPVQLVFLLIGPRKDTSRHIRILSRVSRMMSDDNARDRILSSRTREQALESIAELEPSLFAE